MPADTLGGGGGGAMKPTDSYGIGKGRKTAPAGVSGDKKISGLKKPGKQGKVGGISTPFSNRIHMGKR
jgi:hypothetical protein